MARDIYRLEAITLETTHAKALSICVKGPPALRRIATVCLDEVREEASREVDPLAPRHQRQLLLFRQAQLVSRLRSEHETALMMLEDGDMRARDYQEKRNWLLNKALQLVQGREVKLAGQRDKLVVRNPGFAANMVQSLHLWSVDPASHSIPSPSAAKRGTVVSTKAKDLRSAARAAREKEQREQENEHRRIEINRLAWAAQLLSSEIIGTDEALRRPLPFAPQDVRLPSHFLATKSAIGVSTAITVDGEGGADTRTLLEREEPEGQGAQPDLLSLLYVLQLVEWACLSVAKKPVVSSDTNSSSSTKSTSEAAASTTAAATASSSSSISSSSSSGKGGGTTPNNKNNTTSTQSTAASTLTALTLQCAQTVAQSLKLLRHWRDDYSGNAHEEQKSGGDGEVAVLLVHVIRALKALLGTPLAVARRGSAGSRNENYQGGGEGKPDGEGGTTEAEADPEAEAEDGVEKDLWSWGVEGFTDATLAEHLVHWLLIVRSERLCLPRSPVSTVGGPPHVRLARASHRAISAVTYDTTLGIYTVHGDVADDDSSSIDSGEEGGGGHMGSPTSDIGDKSFLGGGQSLAKPSVVDSLTALSEMDSQTLHSPLAAASFLEGSVMDGSAAHSEWKGPGRGRDVDVLAGVSNCRIPPQPHDDVSLGSCCAVGSPIVADLLYCCSVCVTTFSQAQPVVLGPKTSAGMMNPTERMRREAFESHREEVNAPVGSLPGHVFPAIYPLLEASLALAKTCIENYAFMLRGVEGLNLGSTQLVSATDEEGAAALRLVSTVFSTGLLLPSAVAVLREARALSKSRLPSYFIQGAFLLALQQALLAFTQQGPTLLEVTTRLSQSAERRTNANRNAAQIERDKEKALLGGIELDDEGPLQFEAEIYTPPRNPLLQYKTLPPLPGSGLGRPSLAGSTISDIDQAKPAASEYKSLKEAEFAAASLRNELRVLLDFDLTNHVVMVMSQHRNSLTIQAQGLSSLRLLMREPLMRKALLSNFMDVDEDDKVDLGEEEPYYDDDYEREAASVHTHFTLWRGNLWTREQYRWEETGRGVEHINFTALLVWAGENHLQCVEVSEQLLLLLDHLCRSSHVCKLSLMEAGMPQYVERVKAMYPGSLYLLALCEVVLEDLHDDSVG